MILPESEMRVQTPAVPHLDDVIRPLLLEFRGKQRRLSPAKDPPAIDAKMLGDHHIAAPAQHQFDRVEMPLR
jgi:hypothetical protein